MAILSRNLVDKLLQLVECDDGMRGENESWCALRVSEAQEIVSADGGACFADWAILTLMTDEQVAGRIVRDKCFGRRMLRIDVPTSPTGSEYEKRFYLIESVFQIRLVSREAALGAAGRLAGWDAPAVPISKDTEKEMDKETDTGAVLETETQDSSSDVVTEMPF